ncbi:hypothetical protein KBD75_00585 [Candidatus Woesebacteria bacterium]|nr:hypothetical protein [Candidatus Woesebacteria bacterium]
MSSIILVCWLFISLALSIYSYGFLDFNLTLSSHPLFLSFVAPLQHLVYFDRPLSVKIYAVLMGLFFLNYCITLLLSAKGKIIIFPWKPFLSVITILTLAYPMLSYDVFNYMFHGKILWFYHMNPHLHAPLEFTGDLWLRFMRWVHTPSAYGPVFTAIESPAYLLGLGKFVPVLFLMKMTMSGFFVWSVYLIGRIGEVLKLSHSKVVMSQLLIALNPFLLMEVVVNGHNDAVMLALFLLSLLYALRSKLVPSLFALLLSVGTKFMTALTIPIYFIRSPKLKVWFSFLILLLPVLVSPGRFQPWYLVWAIIPAALIDSQIVSIWIVLSSLAGLVFYAPYIATGFWVNSLQFVVMIVYLPVLTSGSIWFIKKLWMKTK